MLVDTENFPPVIVWAAREAWHDWQTAHPTLSTVISGEEVIARLCRRLRNHPEYTALAETVRQGATRLATRELPELLGL